MFWSSSRLDVQALYWEPPERDGRGNYKWGFPQEISSRWKDSGSSIRYDKNGAEVVSSSVVWIQNDNLLLGGYLMRGTLYSMERLNEPPLEESAEEDSQEYARQIIDMEAIRSVYNKKLKVVKVWLK